MTYMVPVLSYVQRKCEQREGMRGREGMGGLSLLVQAWELEGPAVRQLRFTPVGGQRVWRVLRRWVLSELQGTWLVNDGLQGTRLEAGRWVKRSRKCSGKKWWGPEPGQQQSGWLCSRVDEYLGGHWRPPLRFGGEGGRWARTSLRCPVPGIKWMVMPPTERARGATPVWMGRWVHFWALWLWDNRAAWSYVCPLIRKTKLEPWTSMLGL